MEQKTPQPSLDIEAVPWPQLHLAARAGNVDEVRDLLNKGRYEVNMVATTFNETPLHKACKQGRLNVARLLIGTFNADMAITNRDGATAIMLAIERGRDNVAHVLLEDYQCPVDIRDQNGDTVLHYACRVNATQSIKTLIQKYNAEKYLVNTHNDQCLQVSIASRSGEVDKVRRLLQESGCNVNVTDNKNWTPLHYACTWGDLDMARIWIGTFKADMAITNSDGYTALMLAIKHNLDNVVRALLKDYQCPVDIRGKDGNTVLHYACANGKLDLARILIAQEADMNIQNNDDCTALMMAIKSGYDNVAHALLEDYQCPLYVRDKHGNTILHYACGFNATQTMRTLIKKYKVDVNSRNKENNTPLHVAAYRGKQEVALVLIQEFGCDINSKGFKGKSALHYAVYGGYADMVKCLSKYISPLVVDDDGDTPLHTCCKNGNKVCVEALLALNAPALIRNNSGETPKDVAKSHERIKNLLEQHIKKSTYYKKIKKRAKKRYSSSQHITRIFVLGNSGAGKSSFIATLKREGFFGSLRRVPESSVPPHTAGIVPSIHTSKHYGRVLFYDFAGDAEYYSSHAAILENLACTSKGDNIFIIMVDLREDSHKISCLLNYWVSFIQYQLFKERKPHLVILGSHLDLVMNDKVHEFKKIGENNSFEISGCFMLDCCKPRSKEVSSIVKHITTLVRDSPRYSLSVSDKSHVNMLLGLLEKDFPRVTACPIQTIISHIKDTRMPLLTDKESVRQMLFELHELGLLFMIKGDKNKVQLILNISRLTHDVHQLLFSEKAIESFREKSGNASLLHVGIISEAVLSEVLPAHITKEILIQLQYCQVIHHKDVGTFSSSDQCNSSVQSYLFFPALCSAEKSDIAWVTPPDLSYGIGWLARCTDPRDYFPPRFHHVLFLRLVHTFSPKVSVAGTPSVSADQDTGPHQYRCTMCKTGLHWSTREGVECIVEIVHDNRGVVIRVSSESGKAEVCATVIKQLIQCVLEAKAEFCHTVRPQFFLLNSTSEADYLNPDNLFGMTEVNLALTSEGIDVIFSAEDNGKMKRSKVLWMRKLTHWNDIFPITLQNILHYSKDIIGDIYDFGLYLDLPPHVLEALQVNFPRDVIRMKREVVKEWMSSSQTPPCWCTLAEALRTVGKVNMAAQVKEEHGEFVNVL